MKTPAVMLSIKPSWCEKIISGEKTVEIRKTRPTRLKPPFKVYIYCTKATDKLWLPDKQVCGLGFNTVICENQIEKANGRMRPGANLGNGNIIGEFICDNIRWNGGSVFVIKEDRERATAGSCVGRTELLDYLGIQPGTSIYDKKYQFYCWHISELVVYDKPHALSLYSVSRAPQSWCYCGQPENN